MYVDAEGVLRTNHVLRLWSSTVVHPHYKLTPARRSEDFRPVTQFPPADKHLADVSGC